MEQFRRLYNEKGVRRFYIGGAMGVHIWAGELVLQLKSEQGYEDIELMIVLPFPGHDAQWDIRSKKRLKYLLENCTEYLCIGELPGADNYIRQNRYLADHSEFLLAVSDGTGKMVGYALKKGVPVLCIHPDTAAVDGNFWCRS